MLKTTQMKMMRAMLDRRKLVKQSPEIDDDKDDQRQPEIETWLQWVVHVTEGARQTMRTNSIPDWV